MTVEIADERFGLLPEFSEAKAGVPAGASGLDLPVTWPEGDIGALAGRTGPLPHSGEAGPARSHRGSTASTCELPANAPTLARADYRVREFGVRVGERTVTAKVLSRPGTHWLRTPALLLTFATIATPRSWARPYGQPAQYFLAHGHRAASLTLPSHGERVDALGEGIAGWRNAFVAGEGPVWGHSSTRGEGVG